MKSERTTGSFIPVNLRNPAVFIALCVSFFECIGFARPCDILNHAALGAGRNGSAARNTNKDRRQKADCEYDPHVATFLSLTPGRFPRQRSRRPFRVRGGDCREFPGSRAITDQLLTNGRRSSVRLLEAGVDAIFDDVAPMLAHLVRFLKIRTSRQKLGQKSECKIVACLRRFQIIS
jgi:hypothetical protein